MGQVAAGVGMIAQIAGGIIGGQSARAAGEDEYRIKNYQAAIAQQNALYETQLGERRATELGLKQGQLLGQIRAGQAASGVDVTGGSATAVRRSEQAVFGIEQADIRDAAARKARGEVVQAQLDLAAGQAAKRAGKIKEWGTYISAAAGVADKWSKASSMGLTPGGGGGGGDGTDFFATG